MELILSQLIGWDVEQNVLNCRKTTNTTLHTAQTRKWLNLDNTYLTQWVGNVSLCGKC